MKTRIGVLSAAVIAATATTLGTYAVAQQSPAAEKKPPPATQPAPAPGAQRGMRGGGGPHGSMMHGSDMPGGMHGSMMQGGMECPMAGANLADVKIEKTKNGAVIRLSAKDPADTEKVQRMALMAALHFGADAGAMIPPASAAKP